jgi:peroxiredoxin Q/BCP
MLATERPAPEFELPNQDGEPVRLSDFEGQRVVLYFYPRADTPGCTKEACGFRDAWDAFEDHGITVLGVSNDSIEDLAAFKSRYDLPFTLLSDPDGDVASTYESYGTREIKGEEWEIAFRNTYLIDKDGRIEQIYENVSPEGHSKEILTGLR